MTTWTPAPLRGLELEKQTLPGLLELGAERFGDKPLLRFDDLERSFTEVRDEVAAAAGTLAEAGISRGDRVAMMCENRIELLDLMLGCAWLGAVAVPLNTALRGPQLEHQLANSGARVLAMDAVPTGVAEGEVFSYLAAVPGVEEVHDLHIWGLSTTETALTAHLVCSDASGDRQLHELTAELRQRFGIGHATLQIETSADAELCRLRPRHVV